jgi:inorganic pyrophosphatase
VKILHWGGPEEAHRLILEGIERAKSEKSNPTQLGHSQT